MQAHTPATEAPPRLLVVFGANGRTGREVVAEALRQGWTVRAVVRDDLDGRGLDRVIGVERIAYADADHPAALPPVLVGATHVVIAINARTAGPGCPRYSDAAAAHIVRAAVAGGCDRILHLSVVGSFRWSPHPLNRRSFRLDREVRLLKDLPWSMIRVSCYFDEVIDGHVRPPDGGRPHAILDSARYSPISRRDVARMLVDHLPDLKPNRTMYMGGPQTWVGTELRALVGPWVQPGAGRRTSAGALPPGDMSCSPEQTRVMVTTRPVDRLQDALDPSARPAAPPAPAPAPAAHPADQGRDVRLLREMGVALRFVVHDQLTADLPHVATAPAGLSLDFRSARARKDRAPADVHGGQMVELTGVKALGPDEVVLHRGAVNFVWDPLADVFHCWWEREDGAIAPEVWTRLDLGVKRRLVSHPAFAQDPRVQAFRGGHEAPTAR